MSQYTSNNDITPKRNFCNEQLLTELASRHEVEAFFLFLFFWRQLNREPQMLDEAFPCEWYLMPDFCVSSQVCWMCVLQSQSLQAWVHGTMCLWNGVHVCSCLSLKSVRWKIIFTLLAKSPWHVFFTHFFSCVKMSLFVMFTDKTEGLTESLKRFSACDLLLG